MQYLGVGYTCHVYQFILDKNLGVQLDTQPCRHPHLVLLILSSRNITLVAVTSAVFFITLGVNVSHFYHPFTKAGRKAAGVALVAFRGVATKGSTRNPRGGKFWGWGWNRRV